MKWPWQRKSDSLVSDVASALRSLDERLDQISQPERDLPTTSFAMVERMESLENRFEELRGMCLRHVQSASQRLKRAEDMHGERELNGEDMAVGAAIPPLPPETNGTAAEDEVSDLQWGVQQLRARGESAII